MEQPQQPVGRGPDPAEQPKRTDVNYSAGLDPDYKPGSESSPGNPMDDAMAIRGMFGAMHNELNEVNSNIVEQSSGLKNKNVDKSVMDRDILNLMGRSQTQQQMGQPPQAHQQPQHQPGAAAVEHDPNQFEFNFDNSATAQDIFNRLSDIEAKVNKIANLLQEKK